ncbi:lipocalin-like domain-containing protein [Variovorax sp. J22R187]|nr:lipocalin-like domain-containing protein [Variovorax sp. J22R187]MDM0022240.1 lipocalin-like domain-containing protein [Variovorax sp. J22R187]
MEQLDGIWRLVEARAWDEATDRLSAPYGEHPVGMITFSNGRMLAALCNGDRVVPEGAKRSYSSYGGVYTFDGSTLETLVDVASDPSRIGGRQVRKVEMRGAQLVLRPPTRRYGEAVQKRELIWERVWQPA